MYIYCVCVCGWYIHRVVKGGGVPLLLHVEKMRSNWSENIHTQTTLGKQATPGECPLPPSPPRANALSYIYYTYHTSTVFWAFQETLMPFDCMTHFDVPDSRSCCLIVFKRSRCHRRKKKRSWALLVGRFGVRWGVRCRWAVFMCVCVWNKAGGRCFVCACVK